MVQEKISITVSDHILRQAEKNIKENIRIKSLSHFFEIAADDLLWKLKKEELQNDATQRRYS